MPTHRCPTDGAGTRLLLITQSFPYGERSDFLADEIVYLADRFEQIIVAPTAPRGERSVTPDNVVVDDRLAPMMTRAGRLRSALSRTGLRLAGNEVRSAGHALRSPKQWGRLIISVGASCATFRWATRHDCCDVDLAYTYWMTSAIIGLRTACPELQIVSRAHGGDLFAERHPAGYLPQQAAMVSSSDHIASVSAYGASYLRNRFPDSAERIVHRALGTQACGRNTGSTDDVLRIVSCSYLKPVKRPLLAARALVELARDRRVEWIHFGDGPARAELEAFVEDHASEPRTSSGAGLDVSLRGAVAQRTIAEHYATRPVDMFLNTSSSEGVPVSIMEAVSAGIPVVATDVGGTSEVVVDEVGILVSANPTPSEVANAIERSVEEGEDDREQRIEFWASHYDARVNYDEFARWLAGVAAGSTSER